MSFLTTTLGPRFRGDDESCVIRIAGASRIRHRNPSLPTPPILRMLRRRPGREGIAVHVLASGSRAATLRIACRDHGIAACDGSGELSNLCGWRLRVSLRHAALAGAPRVAAGRISLTGKPAVGASRPFVTVTRSDIAIARWCRAPATVACSLIALLAFLHRQPFPKYVQWRDITAELKAKGCLFFGEAEDDSCSR